MAGPLLFPRALLVSSRAIESTSALSSLGTSFCQFKHFSQEAEGDDVPTQARKPKPADAWRARVPPDMRKHGFKLKRDDVEAFERMRVLLGYYDMPPFKHLKPRSKISKVTISNLQTLRYMGFEPSYKFSVLRYKMNTLNRELQPIVSDTQDILAKLKAGQGSTDFVPSIPGMTAADAAGQTS